MSHWCKEHGETHDCGQCARAAERAAIVAWLRVVAEGQYACRRGCEDDIADSIRDGEHIKIAPGAGGGEGGVAMADVTLKLVFDTEDTARDFVAGLLDGWGENIDFDITWADGKTPWDMHNLRVSALPDEGP
jgi:hypothetical protein